MRAATSTPERTTDNKRAQEWRTAALRFVNELLKVAPANGTDTSNGEKRTFNRVDSYEFVQNTKALIMSLDPSQRDLYIHAELRLEWSADALGKSLPRKVQEGAFGE